MIINNITDIQRVIQASKATTYDRLQQHIQNAEKAFVLPLLGNNLYQAMADYSTSDDNPKYTTPSQQQLQPEIEQGDTDADKKKAWALVLWNIQHAAIHLAYHVGFDVLSAYISDAGFRRQESDNSKSLFKYQEDNLKKYFHETGMNSLDSALEVLESNINHFDLFLPVLTNLKSQFFPDTKTFQHHYNINNSRLVFMRLKQHIKTVEEITIMPFIGSGNYAFILEELQKSSPNPNVTSILPYIRDPLAYLSVAMLMEESGADITERGLYFKGQRSITNSDFVMPANEKRIDYLVARNKEIADRYLARLQNKLSADEWDGDFANTGLHKRDNADKRTFWA